MTSRMAQTRNVEEAALSFDSIECVELRERLFRLASGSCVVELVGEVERKEEVLERVEVDWDSGRASRRRR